MGCDSWKDYIAADAQKASERRLAQTENVEFFGHSLEKIQDIQRHQAYLEIRQYAEERSFLFRPVAVTVTSDAAFVAEGVTNEGAPVEIEFDSRQTREFSVRNHVSVANVKQWPKTAAVETATP